jgi:hypothetical protein
LRIRPKGGQARRLSFIERDRELDRLDAFLTAAERGRGGVVFVSGEAGQGKTSRLLDSQATGWERISGSNWPGPPLSWVGFCIAGPTGDQIAGLQSFAP